MKLGDAHHEPAAAAPTRLTNTRFATAMIGLRKMASMRRSTTTIETVATTWVWDAASRVVAASPVRSAERPARGEAVGPVTEVVDGGRDRFVEDRRVEAHRRDLHRAVAGEPGRVRRHRGHAVDAGRREVAHQAARRRDVLSRERVAVPPAHDQHRGRVVALREGVQLGLRRLARLVLRGQGVGGIVIHHARDREESARRDDVPDGDQGGPGGDHREGMPHHAPSEGLKEAVAPARRRPPVVNQPHNNLLVA